MATKSRRAVTHRKRKDVYVASAIKRHRRNKAAVEQLERQICAALDEDHPQSVRHVFYQMTNPRLPEPVEKSQRGYRHVQNRCVKLRRSGEIPFGWITDASRRGYHTPTYQDASDFLRSVNRFYRADVWRDADHYCEVWTESRSIAGVIENDCDDLAVSLYPAGGFTSISLAYQAAEFINREADGRDVVILYIGDYDPAGVLIDVALERELSEHLNDCIDFTFRRIGVTAEQVIDYDLPTKPRKKTDKRALHIKETVEAEAMPAHLMRELLRAEIETMLPPRSLAVAKFAEQSERQQIERAASWLARGGDGDE